MAISIRRAAAAAKTAAILSASLPLAACISFGAKPPPSLLTLDTTAQLPVGQTQSSATSPSITVMVPSVPQELAVARVPVQATDTSIAYVKDAQWVEPPARLFARLLSDTIAAQTGRVVLSSAQAFTSPGAQLTGELRQFGIVAGSNEAVVSFEGALVRNGQQSVEKRRFEARVPVSAIDRTTVGPALNQAANQVAQQVAAWVGR